ncbi:PLDc N-terminal domain-containing protein [Herbiconiux sp. SYSU D00978]|uniref:PLDc N-terminal domain-containing protein n=1 Tax=Herbiconiux sp. SYSU D00978 TaxID=2812562 RepID=UPI001A95B19A|nr:PLDc N-terminal domain-containing protein [Herbiconiux sp. SYSU D00978]
MSGETPDGISIVLPAAYDIVWSFAPLLLLFLVAVTVINIAYTHWLTTQEKLLWAALAVFVPVLGALAWWLFLAGATARRRRPGA